MTMHKFIVLIASAGLILLAGCGKSSDTSTSASANSTAPKKLTIALMPKSKGNAYFVSCKQGADEAAKELGVEIIFDGPTDPDPAKQNEIVENWITLGVDKQRVMLIVAHTFRAVNDQMSSIRIINSRKATKAEQRQYEQRRR